MTRKAFSAEGAVSVGPYSHAVESNNHLFLSGQTPLDSHTGQLVEGGIKEQTEQVMKNIGYILEEAGYSYKDVVKSTCLLSDISSFADMNAVYGEYYKEECPARAAFAVKDLPLGALVEIETIAVK